MSPSESSAARRNVLAGTVGSVLEWYDCALYAASYLTERMHDSTARASTSIP